MLALVLIPLLHTHKTEMSKCPKVTYKVLCSNFTHNCPKLETTYISTNIRIQGYLVAHSHNGILHSQETHTTQIHLTDTGLSEGTQTHSKYTCCMIPFM